MFLEYFDIQMILWKWILMFDEFFIVVVKTEILKYFGLSIIKWTITVNMDILKVCSLKFQYSILTSLVYL